MDTTQGFAFAAAYMSASRPTTECQSVSWRNFLGEMRSPPQRGLDAFLSETRGGGHEHNRGAPKGAVPVANPHVLELTHDAVCVANMSGVIEYWNRSAEELYGWTADEAVGRVGHALLKTVFSTPLDRIEAEVLETGAWEGELVHAHKDGTRVTVASRWCLLHDEASLPVAIVESNHDITERKRVQAERAKLEERLRHAEKMEAIGRFACGIAHDFNNVLGTIIPFAEKLVREAPPTSTMKEGAQTVFSAALRGRHLADQILSYSRNQRGARTPVDVCRSVVETLQLVQGSLSGSITLHTTIPDAPLVIAGDATQLHQVVMNLCTNSIHAMKSGGALRVAVAPMHVEADRALSHGTLKPGRYVRVSVADAGCGMDAATLARMFEPFFTTRKRGLGTGLGLALVHTIVADFGGTIDVKSVPEQGSTFSIYIPLAGGSDPALARN